MKRTGWAILAALLLFDGTAAYSLQRTIDGRRGGMQVLEELGRLPKGEYIKRVSFGYDAMVADFIWLKVVQVMGEKDVPPQNARWIFHAIDVASDLDPKFWYMYQAGGVFLSAITHNYEDSISLLKKGFQNNPERWELPFYIGVNYFLYLENYPQAAYYMGEAAKLPGRPEFVPLLTTRLYAEAGEPRYALDIIESIRSQTKDEKVRQALDERMKKLVVEINLNALEEAASEYRKRYGRYPGSVGELIAAGVLRGAPRDPFGGGYRLDPKTGKASSTVLKERLRTYKRGGAK